MLTLFQSITPPQGVTAYTDPSEGVMFVISLAVKLIFIAAGLFAFANFIMGGFLLIGSGGDKKQLEQARDKFVWTLIGFVVMMLAAVITGFAGYFVYGDWQAILFPKFTNTPTP